MYKICLTKKIPELNISNPKKHFIIPLKLGVRPPFQGKRTCVISLEFFGSNLGQLQICPEMQVNEMHALHGKHHKVSSFLKSH